MTQFQQDHVFSPTCACPGCTGTFDPDYASLDPLAGGTANNKPIWTPEQIAAYLNRTGGGFANGFGNEANNGIQNNIGDGNDVITFGFFNTQEQVANNGYTYVANDANGVPTNYGLNEYFGFSAFTEAQREATRESMQYWDDVVAVTFREASADEADMNFGNLTNRPGTQAYARIPTAGLDSILGGQVREIGGDVWVTATTPSNFQLDEGLYGMNTLTHEIGHALGLSHPGNYNFAPGFAVNYINGAEYAQDARNYTIMSYWNPRDLGSTPTGVPTRDFDWSLMSIAYGSTPMIHDILAIQAMYGADMTTRTGDTTYGFNSNAGRDAFDFEKTPWPTMTIWDAGGNDTLDASGYAVTQVIDLTPGSLSSIGGITYEEALRTLTFEQVNANRVAAGYAPITQATYDANMAAFAADPNWRGRLTDNVGIAYGAMIENAIGGSGMDTIIGNTADNRLSGNAGADVLAGREGADSLYGGVDNDVLIGGSGADLLDGGDGFDTASYRDSATGVTINLTNNRISVTGDGVGDRFVSIEAFDGSELADRLNGGNAADTLSGLGGNDIINGGNGADRLDGGAGNDAIDGGNDADTLLGGAGNDVLTGGNGDDTLDGGAGSDRLSGGNGNDRLTAGDGFDYLTGGNGSDRFVLEMNSARIATSLGSLSVDTITDYQSGDTIDLSAFAITAAAVTTQTYASVSAAEAALGIDLDGTSDRSPYAGPVTVLLGDVDGNGADFAVALLGTGSVNTADLVFA